MIPVLIADGVLAVALLWVWSSGWARDDGRPYRKMQRTYKRKGR